MGPNVVVGVFGMFPNGCCLPLLFLMFIFIEGDRQINPSKTGDTSSIRMPGLTPPPMPKSFSSPTSNLSKPMFDGRLASNLSVSAGDVATLRCRVFNRGDRTVSWLRADTTQILAAGSYTYVSDMRYTAAHSDTRDT